MKIPEDRRIDILMNQLQERYSALHKMRDRSMQFVLWVLGFGFGLAWLSINEVVFSAQQKVAITLLLIVIAAVTVLFVRAISHGFNNNRGTAIRIEKALGLYESNSHGTEEAILPSDFSDTKTRWSSHFVTLYVLTAAVVLILLVLTWANPCADIVEHADKSADPNQTTSSVVQQ